MNLGMSRLLTWHKIVLAIILVMFIAADLTASVAWWLALEYAPKNPYPTHGLVVPLNNHGIYYYITRQRHLVIVVSEVVEALSMLFGLGFYAAVSWFDPSETTLDEQAKS